MQKMKMGLLAALMLLMQTAWGAEDKTFDALSMWGSWDLSGMTVGQTYNVTYNHVNYEPGHWELFGLPFDADQALLDGAFGQGNYQLAQFSQLSGATFMFAPMETPAVTAGQPYLVKVSQDVTTLSFPGVTWQTSEGVAVGNGQVKLQISFFTISTTPGRFVFYNGSVTEMGWGSGQVNITLPALRGYFTTDGTVVPQIDANNGVREQLSNVPTIYIDIPDVVNLDSDLKKEDGEALYHRADIEVIATDDTTSPNYLESFKEEGHLSIKVRGNSTSKAGKRPYRLKFDKKDAETGANFKHDLLGRGYRKRNWTLLANAFDNSFIRNAVMSLTAQRVGMDFVPGYKYVDLVINGNYRGTYQVSDHCEVDADRINVDEQTGWYVEFQGRSDMLDHPMCFTAAGKGLSMNVKKPEPDNEDDEAQRQAVLEPIEAWFTGEWLNGWAADTYTDPVNGWRKLNDEEAWLKFILVTELTADWDGYMTVKAYREADGKLKLGPIWDKDLAYGNYSNASIDKLVVDYANGSSLADKIALLYKDREFINRLRLTLDKLVDEGLEQYLLGEIDALAARLQQTASLNFNRWGYTPPGEWGSIQAFSSWTSYDAYINQLKEWIPSRIERVQAEFLRLSEQAGLMDIDLEGNAREQLSDVPTIYIDTTEEIQPSTGNYVNAAFEVVDKKGTLDEIVKEPSLLQIRGRGDFENAGRKSYRLKFAKKNKVALLGAKEDPKRNWVLLANEADATHMRNALAKELGDAMGLAFTPGYQFVDLVLNGEFVGTYQVTDFVQADAARVNVDEDYGWLIEMANEYEVAGEYLVVAGDADTPWLNIKNPDPDDMTVEQQEAHGQLVKSFFDRLWAATDGSFIDKESFVNWYVACEITGNYKALASIYAYKEENGEELFFGPLWNNDKAWNNKLVDGQDMTYDGLMADLDVTHSFNGMLFNTAKASAWKDRLALLWREPWFKEAVTARWQSLYGSETDNLLTTLLQKVDQLKAEVAKASEPAGDEAVEVLKTYLTQRFPYLDKKFAELASAVVLGDADDNGVVDNADAVAILRYLMGNAPATFNPQNADVNQDGVIDNADAVLVLRLLLANP